MYDLSSEKLGIEHQMVNLFSVYPSAVKIYGVGLCNLTPRLGVKHTL
ncbi:hypothetical protein FDUTEX481_10026 [Tolypothrix sp. PCC 7601]|nr:hypothetical protein FDUTEX481_10026 [Tolypothrix sp. PCC 7601]